MIYFKHDRQREEFLKVDPDLRNIIEVFSALLSAIYKVRTVITSVFREDKHSPHYYYRAVDIRSGDMKPTKCIELANIMNIIFKYGSGPYNTVLYHSVGTGWHFHLQVKP